MILLINNQIAVLEQGTSFDYVTENPLFTDAEAYTLNIDLPLKDCPQNQAIFGQLHRKDVPLNTNIFPAELRDKSFVKRGTITITEFTPSTVSVQFLEGRSSQNNDSTFDEIYINELELGYNIYYWGDGDDSVMPPSKFPVTNLGEDHFSGVNWQAVPWVNNYSGNIQNKIKWDSNGNPSWDCSQLSYQIYLYNLTLKIFEAVGYEADLECWLQSDWFNLLLCNTLPAAWEIRNIALALPHWTVAEYIAQLGLFFTAEFEINHTEKTITMRFTKRVLEHKKPVILSHILQEFKTKQTESSRSEYTPMNNLAYADCNHGIWKYMNCPWLIRQAGLNWWETKTIWLTIAEYDTLAQLIATRTFVERITTGTDNGDLVTSAQQHNIYYVRELDRYYIMRLMAKTRSKDPVYIQESGPGAGKYYEFTFTFCLQPLNAFAPHIVDEEAQTKTCKIVPAWLDDTGDRGKGLLYFLDAGEYDNMQGNYTVAGLLEDGEKSSTEYYDKLYVGFYFARDWYGDYRMKYPHPYIDYIDVNTDNHIHVHNGCSLVFRDQENETRLDTYQINRTYKYEFSFLADEIPDVRAVFLIHGQRFLCERVTATFTENGLSQLMKGEFYRIED